MRNRISSLGFTMPMPSGITAAAGQMVAEAAKKAAAMPPPCPPAMHTQGKIILAGGAFVAGVVVGYLVAKNT